MLSSPGWLAPRVASLTGDAEYSLSAVLRVRGDQVRMEVELSDALGEPIWSGAFDGFVQAGRDVAAMAESRNILRRTRDFSIPMLAMASASAHLGEPGDARAAVADALRLSPQESIEGWRTRIGLADAGPNDRFLDGLRMAGFPQA